MISLVTFYKYLTLPDLTYDKVVLCVTRNIEFPSPWFRSACIFVGQLSYSSSARKWLAHCFRLLHTSCTLSELILAASNLLTSGRPVKTVWGLEFVAFSAGIHLFRCSGDGADQTKAIRQPSMWVSPRHKNKRDTLSQGTWSILIWNWTLPSRTRLDWDNSLADIRADICADIFADSTANAVGISNQGIRPGLYVVDDLLVLNSRPPFSLSTMTSTCPVFFLLSIYCCHSDLIYHTVPGPDNKPASEAFLTSQQVQYLWNCGRFD